MSNIGPISFDLIQNSIQLDTKIYIKLSGILINEILDYKLDSLSPNCNTTHLTKTDFHSTFEKDLNDSSNLENKKIKNLVKIFDLVNKERLILRETLILLIKKKFWKITEDKTNSNFFVNKMKGMDIDVMKKRIEKLEFICVQKDKEITEKNKILQELQNENCLNMEIIKKQSTYLKDSILNNSVIFEADLSSNSLRDFQTESVNHNPKSVRKFKRRNSNFCLNEEPKDPPKKSLFIDKVKKSSLFQNEEEIKRKKKKKDLQNFDFNSNMSSDEDFELTGQKRNNNLIKRERILR